MILDNFYAMVYQFFIIIIVFSILNEEEIHYYAKQSTFESTQYGYFQKYSQQTLEFNPRSI